MRTSVMLAQLPEKHKKYLKMLKTDIAKAKEGGLDDVAKEYKAVARGYIRCLAECGIVCDFKTVWGWFTTPIAGTKI